MISASHNPMPDNGIKFFARVAEAADDVEDQIERRLGEAWDRPLGAGSVGSPRVPEAGADYVAALVRDPARQLDGLHVVLDCAHGAASVVAPQALREAGATSP